MELREMDTTALIPAGYNPREISKEAREGLKKSIGRFGLVQPIIWNERTGRVVGGHQRLSILIEEGTAKTQVVVVDLPEAEEKALNVAMNNPHIAGNFTPDLKALLAEINTTLPELYVDLKLDTLQIDLFPKPKGAGHADPDDIPPVTEDTIAQPGDLWKLGPHRLLVGDSTQDATWRALLGTDRPNLLFTDPPYGVSFGTKNYNPKAKKWGTIANDELTGEALYSFCRLWIERVSSFCAPATPVYVWTASMAEGYTILRALQEGGLHMQSQLIWAKNVFALGQADYHWRHEICWYGWTPGKGHFWAGGRAQSTIWEENRDPQSQYKHPTQKPVALAQRAIKNSCPEGGMVVDPFAGSGSTLIACEQTGRTFRGIEMSPVYADVIVKRWERYTAQKAERSSVI